MKKLFVVLFAFLCFKSSVFGCGGNIFSDNLKIIIQNVEEKIVNIEIYSIEEMQPSKVFDYEIERTSNNSGEVRLYRTDIYDQKKYVLQKGDFSLEESDLVNTYKYLDINHQKFNFYKLGRMKDISGLNIKNNDLKIILKNLNKYINYSFLVRLYKENGEYKEIFLINNYLLDIICDGRVNTIIEKIDYNTKEIDIKSEISEAEIFKDMCMKVFIVILIFLFLKFQMFITNFAKR